MYSILDLFKGQFVSCNGVIGIVRVIFLKLVKIDEANVNLEK